MIFHSKVKALLKIERFEKSFKLSESVRNKFSRPILFHLSNDDYPFLSTFVKIDFRKEKLIYYKLLSDENISILEKLDIPNYPSHSSLGAGNGFFNFLFLQPNLPHDTFRYFDLEKLMCYVFSASEVFDGKYSYVSETSGLDCTRNDHFLIGVGKQNTNYYEIYSCSFDLQEKVKIIEIETHKYPPHDVRSYDDFIFATEFFDQRVKMPNGQIVNDYIELEKLIYDSNYPESIVAKNIPSYKALEINRFKISPLHGEVLLIDMQKSINFEFLKAGFVPSHIEFLDDLIYVSSHNFLFLKGKMVYLGPAAIDLYRIEDRNIVSVDRFQEPTGYRYTAHKVFKRDGHPYFVTIGHPNRLFLVDGLSMKKVSYIDLGERDVLSKCPDIKTYLNEMDMTDHYHPLRYSTVEASDDGEFLIFWDQTHVQLISTRTFEISSVVDFTIEDFRQKTYHSEKL